MINKLYVLVNKSTNDVIQGPRQFQSPDDDHIRASVEQGTEWIEYVKPEPVVPSYTFEQYRQDTKRVAKLWKIERQNSDFVYDGHSYQNDDRSRDFIAGAVLSSVLHDLSGQSFSIKFTTSDNVDVLLNSMDIKNVGLASATHISGYHEQYKIFRDRIESATTEAELDAINKDLE